MLFFFFLSDFCEEGVSFVSSNASIMSALAVEDFIVSPPTPFDLGETQLGDQRALDMKDTGWDLPPRYPEPGERFKQGADIA